MLSYELDANCIKTARSTSRRGWLGNRRCIADHSGISSRQRHQVGVTAGNGAQIGRTDHAVIEGAARLTQGIGGGITGVDRHETGVLGRAADHKRVLDDVIGCQVAPHVYTPAVGVTRGRAAGPGRGASCGLFCLCRVVVAFTLYAAKLAGPTTPIACRLVRVVRFSSTRFYAACSAVTAWRNSVLSPTAEQAA